MKCFRTATARLLQEITAYRLIAAHPRTPKLAKLLIGAAVAYAVSPLDLIPDFIPVIGHVDDAVIVPLLVIAGMKLVPADVVSECRAKACAGADVSSHRT